MLSNQKQDIARRFGRQCEIYDRDANLQKNIAKNLITHLPEINAPRILEIGCGTGFLTKGLVRKYPDGVFDITDLSQEMVNKCKENNKHKNTRFFTLDGESKTITKDYDLIVSSMAFQWFSAPEDSLKKLSQHAPVYYASLGNDNFNEWINISKQHNISDGTLPSINWPNIIDEEYIVENHKDGKSFFKHLKSIGAAKPKDKYTPEKYARIKKALNNFDGKITWHIVYGYEPLSR